MDALETREMTRPNDLEARLKTVRERRMLLGAMDRWLLDQVHSHLGQRILEVGCGCGNLTAALLDRALVVATDVSVSSVHRVAVRFADNPNVHACVFDITDPAVLRLREHNFDTVLCLNVLEHIADEQTALTHMRALLGRGGKLVLIVPAHRALYGTMDRAIGHHRRYNRRDLRWRLEAAELTVLELYYTNPLGALGWFVSGRVLRQTVPNACALRVFDKLVPALKRVENRARPPFGVSLVSVSTPASAA
jgi:SAM-dependent methyltransferase